MRQSRERVNVFLGETISRYVPDSKTALEVVKLCNAKYGMTMFRAQTIVRMDASTVELKDPEIFWVLSCIGEIAKVKLPLEKYFSDIEIEKYSAMRYEDTSTMFPLVIKAIQITDTQWIGKISAYSLVRWRGTFLRYNKNIQRRLTTIVRGGQTYEIITLNSKSVMEMENLFLNGEFVPNTITLNIDEDETNFYYDEDSMSLVINSVDHLDLTDGYHRLVALSKALEKNPSLDYTMELRITNFSEARASQFIHQEEQRTAMPKKDVRSFDMTDLANRITRKVNETSTCNLNGYITRGGAIDFSSFSEMVDALYIAGMTDDEKKRAIVNVSKDLVASLNVLTEADTSLIGKKFGTFNTKLLVYVCSRFYNKGKGGLHKLFTDLCNYNYSNHEKQLIYNGKAKRVIKFLNDLLDREGWIL